jgi:hypothetical protein
LFVVQISIENIWFSWNVLGITDSVLPALMFLFLSSFKSNVAMVFWNNFSLDVRLDLLSYWYGGIDRNI